MPIYEYRCEDCQAAHSRWFGSRAQAASATARCAACGSARVTRLVSRFAVGRPGAPATSQAAPSTTTMPRGDDPRSLARSMRAASAGRDMGSDFQEVAARLDAGEQAPAIEASLRKRVGESMQVH